MEEPKESEFPDDPQCFALRTNTRLWRVYEPAHGSVSFNPNVRGDPADPFSGGRFHPFLRSPSNTSVPTMYAARSLQCTIAETILHNLPTDRPSTGYTILLRSIAERRFAIIRPKARLKLLQLTMPGIRRLGGTADEVTLVGVDQYPLTRLWAQAIHAHYPDVAGLTWASRRFGTISSTTANAAMVFFGDRCKPSDFEVAVEDQRLDVEGMAALAQMLRLAGAVVLPS
jgi:hypothetical protein